LPKGLLANNLYSSSVAAIHSCSGTNSLHKPSPGHPLLSASPSAFYFIPAHKTFDFEIKFFIKIISATFTCAAF
jgi:hypothetical protein